MAPIVFPPPLKKGDCIAVVAPASPPKTEALEQGLRLLQQRYTVELYDGVNKQHGYLAGDDGLRTQDFQRALNDETVRAVIAARGGFGTSRIIDRLDFAGLNRTPKWIVGSSDLTALSCHLLATFGIASIHGPMVSGFPRTEAGDLTSLFDLLEGAAPSPVTDLKSLCPGRAQGPLLGGNLTVTAHLMGTMPTHFTDGAILFLEDVGEKPYRLDRCLTQLQRAGALKKIVGLLLGEFTDCPPNPDGVTALDVMKEFAVQAKIPAAFGYPAAHGNRNAPFIQGRSAVLRVTNTGGSVLFP